jgi:hypothetical protein
MALLKVHHLTGLGLPLQGSFEGGRQWGCVEPRHCSGNRCLARWTVWIPHRDRRGGAGRANSNKDLVTGPTRRLFVPYRQRLRLSGAFPNVAQPYVGCLDRGLPFRHLRAHFALWSWLRHSTTVPNSFPRTGLIGRQRVTSPAPRAAGPGGLAPRPQSYSPAGSSWCSARSSAFMTSPRVRSAQPNGTRQTSAVPKRDRVRIRNRGVPG